MFRVRTQLIGGAGGPQVSTLYFSSFPGRTAEAANAAVGNMWWYLREVISGEYTATTEPEVYVLNDGTGEITGTVPVTPLSWAGTASGDPLPWMTQGLMRFSTGLWAGGRLVRGRLFVPGPTEGFNEGGVPSETYITALDVAADNLIAASNAEAMVWSRKNSDTYPILHGSCPNYWAYLASRRS